MKKTCTHILIIIALFAITAFFYQNQRVPQGSSVQTTILPEKDAPTGIPEAISISYKPKSVIIDVGVLPEYLARITPFAIPDLSPGDIVELRWTDTSTTRHYGDSTQICLYAFDMENKIIHDTNSTGHCTYAGYQAYSDPPMSLLLGTTTVSGGQYNLILDEKWSYLFTRKAVLYTLGIIVMDELPSEGRSEWAGLIAGVFTKPFKIINRR